MWLCWKRTPHVKRLIQSAHPPPVSCARWSLLRPVTGDRRRTTRTSLCPRRCGPHIGRAVLSVAAPQHRPCAGAPAPPPEREDGPTVRGEGSAHRRAGRAARLALRTGRRPRPTAPTAQVSVEDPDACRHVCVSFSGLALHDGAPPPDREQVPWASAEHRVRPAPVRTQDMVPGSVAGTALSPPRLPAAATGRPAPLWAEDPPPQGSCAAAAWLGPLASSPASWAPGGPAHGPPAQPASQSHPL